MRKILMALVATLSFGFLPSHAAAEPAVYLVSFTAEWCPNCKILDPKMDAALQDFAASDVEPVVLDMTNASTREASFNKVDGTLLAGVYGDHLGVTGIGILTAADSGEKIGCVTREYSTGEISEIIRQSVNIVRTQTALQRETGIGSCPQANGKVAL